jgi:hypothetical protein
MILSSVVSKLMQMNSNDALVEEKCLSEIGMNE